MLRKTGLAVLLLAAGTGTAAAQSTGTPVFMAPYRAFTRSEVGAALSDPGVGYALQGFYRVGRNRFDIGFTLGFADAKHADASVLAGVDLRTRVIDHTEDFPFDGAFVTGIGGSFRDQHTIGFIPIGVSLGRRLELDDSRTSFVPYVQPTLIPTFGDDSDVLFSLGFGVDLRAGRTVDIRFSAGLGDIDGVSISIAILR